MPLAGPSEDGIWPDDLGVPAGHTGTVFVDAAGKAVSIISQQADSVTVHIDPTRH